MRRVTRNFLIGIGVVVVALLALGALPSYLGSGDPYYMTAERTNASGTAVDVSNVSAERFPYLTTALESGRSEGYQKGPYGIKEAFTNSPFDEFDALYTRAPDARTDDTILVDYKGQRYRVEIVQP